MAQAAPQGMPMPPPGAMQGMPMPPPGAPGGPPPMQIPLNPALMELLDSLPHTPKPFALQAIQIPHSQPPQQGVVVTCPTHQRTVCEQCDVDFNSLNFLHQFLRGAPAEAVPPPPNVPPPPVRAEQIKNAKEQGNVSFKAQQYPAAVQHYSRSADMALSRPPWEVAALGRDETAIALCNRSAAFAFMGAWPNALADAETVVILKRPWTKGHFRKARALMGLNRLEDARQALVDGLQFEPNDKELNSFLKEIDEKIAAEDAA